MNLATLSSAQLKTCPSLTSACRRSSQLSNTIFDAKYFVYGMTHKEDEVGTCAAELSADEKAATQKLLLYFQSRCVGAFAMLLRYSRGSTECQGEAPLWGP